MATRQQRRPSRTRTLGVRGLEAQRLAILVDSENLEITASQNYERGGATNRTHTVFPDWKKILPEVVRGRTVIRSIYYKRKERTVSSKFRQMWEQELRGEILQPIKSVDPYIIVDAIAVAPKVDVVLILAGDKDYLPLIWYLKSHGCKVEIASFDQAAAGVIKTAADHFYVLDAHHTVTLKRSESSRSRRRNS